MPVGGASDPQSAMGILTELCECGPTLVATPESPAAPDSPVLGCVLGGVLDAQLIDSYGLGNFGARAGDGLLAYIGVTPAAQGARGRLRGGHIIEELCAGPDAQDEPGEAVSLASVLFSSWLALPEVSSLPTVFIRTRETIAPILHLLDKHGFDYQGRFEIEFRGECQRRLVYSRENRT